MVTIGHVVKRLIDNSQYLHECLGKGLLNHAYTAVYLKPKVEEELGKEVKAAAVMMALRRYGAEIKRKYDSKLRFDYRSEVTLKSGIVDIAIRRSETVFAKLRQLYGSTDYELGDVLNVIHGNQEISLITSEKNREKILKILEGEKILHIEGRLAQLSLRFPKEYIYTPGIILQLVRVLDWENINIFEIVSTLTEVNFIISESDSSKGYRALQGLVSRG
ncbi:MAG: hypothetical protein HY516_00145 [Candidatus Aenigmarchaeota archaeon]|nr:hypothetical protein [Candidatus Aenigmarchaeota archaeon]